MSEAANGYRLLETSDVARLLGLSYSGLYVILKAGKLVPDFVTPRGLRLFRPETAEAFRLKRNPLTVGTCGKCGLEYYVEQWPTGCPCAARRGTIRDRVPV